MIDKEEFESIQKKKRFQNRVEAEFEKRKTSIREGLGLGIDAESEKLVTMLALQGEKGTGNPSIQVSEQDLQSKMLEKAFIRDPKGTLNMLDGAIPRDTPKRRLPKQASKKRVWSDRRTGEPINDYVKRILKGRGET